MRYRVHPGTELTADVLCRLIEKYKLQSGRLRKLYGYYLGEERRKDCPDACTNLAKYITDTATGYFAGIPPKYVFDDPALGERMQGIFDANDETSVNYRIAEDMSICGVGYDLVWLDEQSEIRITALEPTQVFLICESTVEEKPVAAVRIWQDDTEEGSMTAYGELYTPDTVMDFLYDGTVRFGESRAHNFDGIPITEYRNNRHCQGDFEWSVRNIDLYNTTLSNASSDLQSIANAFLAISGMQGTDEDDIKQLNASRVANLPADGRMEYVTKNLNDTAISNHEKTLKEDILQVAGVPDLSDESFAGNVSGIALEFKLWPLDQLRAKKQQGMDEGLFKRLKLIASALALKGTPTGDIENSVAIRYTRNMPRDTSATVDNVQKLNGIVSEETLFGLLEPVTGVAVADEMERMGQYATEVGLPEEQEAQTSTLNGAQITALLNIIAQIKAGTLTRAGGLSIAVSTLGIDRAAAETFIEEQA